MLFLDDLLMPPSRGSIIIGASQIVRFVGCHLESTGLGTINDLEKKRMSNLCIYKNIEK